MRFLSAFVIMTMNIPEVLLPIPRGGQPEKEEEYRQ